MTAFDLVLRGGLVVDGTGSPRRRADVGVRGGRIVAVGDLAAVPAGNVAVDLDATGRVVAPGFVDPHGHSDTSVLVDGALSSHLRQGFTTQLSGNCGLSLAPLTEGSHGHLEPELRAHDLQPSWSTFAEYLDLVGAAHLGPNVAILVGHGTIRGAVLGDAARDPDEAELAAMVREVELALDAGAFGVSSGLIYAPGVHARPPEVAALVGAAARRGGLYATHLRDEAGGLLEALDEALETTRAAGDGARLQVSHLKVAARAMWGRAGEAIARLEAARAAGLDVAADQYPYAAAATDLAVVLPPALRALATPEVVYALGEPDVRARVRAEIEAGRSAWPDVATDPGWGAIRIAWSPSRPDAAGRSIPELAADAGLEPDDPTALADVALDLLAADGLATAVVLDCMSDADIEAILRVPWIAVCTDAEGRRAGHPILDAGRPHPRTYGTTARVLGEDVRDRGVLSLEAAVAKLSAVPAARLGLADRGLVREGLAADLVVFDPATVADTATYEHPACHPIGIDHVVVNGILAVRDGAETGARPGRLLRHAG